MSECVMQMPYVNEMPKSCLKCTVNLGICDKRLLWKDGANSRHPDCPIICVLPENHGRLIDADKIDYYEVERFGEPHYMVWKPHIDGQPTIVPATERRD